MLQYILAEYYIHWHTTPERERRLFQPLRMYMHSELCCPVVELRLLSFRGNTV